MRIVNRFLNRAWIQETLFALRWEEPMEEVTLIEVKNDGQTLVLLDGRELNVDYSM